MQETEFRKILAQNLIACRKNAGLTQAETAAYINYSDKSVSKWERGDGAPDVFVLTKLAALYGVSIADLTGETTTEPEKFTEPTTEKRHSPFTVCLSVGAVWLIATIAFSVMNMLPLNLTRTYLAFIYAVPATFVVMEIFTVVWKLPAILHLLFSSGILWTLALTVQLSTPITRNSYLIYVIAAVAQLLAIFAMGLFWDMIRIPAGGWRTILGLKKKQ